MKEIVGDYHTHSEYSHGKGEIIGNVEAARKIGLKEIAITDHGPRTYNFIRLGVRNAEEFLLIKDKISEVQKDYQDIKILAGVEANIINHEGDLDVPDQILNRLDIVAAGFHLLIWPPDLRSGWFLIVNNRFTYRFFPFRRQDIRKNNTESIINAVRRHRIDFITHPGYGVDIDTFELARVCAKHGTLLEINARHGELTEGFVQAATETGVNFIVNSDAHSTQQVGKLDSGLELISRLDIDRERIMNYTGYKYINKRMLQK